MDAATQGRYLDTTSGQRLQDAIRAAEIAPREGRHFQDRQGLCARLQNGLREIHRRRECVRLTKRPSFVFTPPEGRESSNPLRQARHTLASGRQQCTDLGHKDKGVPQTSLHEQCLRNLPRRFLQKLPDSVERPLACPGHSFARFDPAILRLRLTWLYAKQDDPLRLPLHKPCRVGHLLHEHPFFLDEMVRRKEHDGRPWIPGGDPLCGEQHRGGGSAALWLLEHMRATRFTELARQISLMTLKAHHDRSTRRNEPSNSVERLTQEGPRPEEWTKLRGSLVAKSLMDEGSQSDALPSREHDRPQGPSSLRRLLALPTAPYLA